MPTALPATQDDAINPLTDFGFTEDALRRLVTEYKDYDATLGDEAYAKVVKGIKVISKLRSSLELARKEKIAGIVRDGKIIDGEARRIKDVLLGIETPMKDSKATVDDESARIESARVAKIQLALEAITVTIVSFGTSLEALNEWLSRIKDTEIDESFDEFYHDALDAKQKSLSVLSQAITSAENTIKEKAELETQRLEQEKVAAEQKEQREAAARVQQAQDDKRFEEQAAINKDRADLEAAQKKLEQDKQDAEDDKLAAKAVADEEKRLRDEAEAERKRLAELEPDKKKLKRWSDELSQMSGPRVKTVAAETLVIRTTTKLDAIADWINEQIGDM